MQDVKNRIEAILFTTGRFLTVDEIASLCNIGSIGVVKDALKELIETYKSRESALELTEQGNAIKLNIRKDYLFLTTKLLSDTELDKPTQETLALVAYRNPILQAEIINMRGNTAYDHIKSLRELEFITSEKKGRTRLLKLTPKFYDYFDVVDDQLKQKFDEADRKEEAEKKEEIVSLEEHEN